MRLFLATGATNSASGASFQFMGPFVLAPRPRSLGLTPFLVLFFCSCALGQLAMPTSRSNNARTNANSNETLLTPDNVNKNTFGKLFTASVDYVVMAQPLYVANVNIPSRGRRNVVYVVTQADSVYAIDADNGAQLWYASMLNVGGTTASGQYLPCGTAPGFNQEGIIGTPVIDTDSGTMYLVAKTQLNGTVRHHLHALDITTGAERPGSPVLISASSVSRAGHKTVFNSLHQKNRPGLLLVNDVLYLGFGSNYCNDSNSGWVLSYDSRSLRQIAVFNTSPDQGLTSIWQSGSGLAADDDGNLFVETAESANNGFDIQNGGQTYCNSVLRLNPDLTVADYFTPWNVAFLNTNDFDLSSTGVLILPDQNGPDPHELIAGGKYGMVYVLNRDNLGMYSAGADSQIIQEIALVKQPNPPIDALFGSPAYWNNNVYLSANASPIMAFPLSGGKLGTAVKSAASYVGSHSPSISANGNSNGVLWVISSGLNALDAVSLKLLYNTNQAPNARDKLGTVAHFATQTVANGRVYVAAETQTSPPAYALVAYGLFHSIAVVGGGGQSAVVTHTLPRGLLIQVTNPYTGQPEAGTTITFSDGCSKAGSVTCGTFNPTSAVTDWRGYAYTTYTVPQKSGTYTLTGTLMVNGTPSGSVTTPATAKASTPTKFVAYGGANQTGEDGLSLSKPIVAQVQDVYKNPVPGVTINFSANKGGIPNPSTSVTDTTGLARTYLQLPKTPSTVTVTATAAPANPPVVLTPAKETYVEYSVATAESIGIVSGNNQTAGSGSTLPGPLVVIVTDEYGNGVPGVNVTFSDGGSGGQFSGPNPGTTSSNGEASQYYTLPPVGGETVVITATAAGVTNPAVFSEYSQ